MSDKASRLLRIYSRLRRGPVTIEILKSWAVQNDIHVSERSLYRHLKEIEKIVLLDNEKVVVSEGEKNRKTWKIQFEDAAKIFNDDDLNALIYFRNFAPQNITKSQQTSVEKIESYFYQGHSKSAFEHKAGLVNFQIASTHFYESEDAANYQKVLADCVWCIQNCREIILNELHFDYTSISKSVKFPLVFLPVQLLYHRGEIHLAGFTKKNEKLLVIALEQLVKYKLTNEMFEANKYVDKIKEEMTDRFGITENINDEIYDIEIEFSPITGAFMKHIFWHKTQKFKKKKNGNYILKMKCGINRELVGWIFQWMSNAKVNKPQILQDKMEEMVRYILDLYTGKREIHSNNIFRRA